METAPMMTLTNTTALDRKSTRLNSSHLVISYAVFCLKKKQRYTWACVEDADGPLAVDDKIIVLQDDLAGLARVVELSRDRDFVLLAVEWESFTDDAYE